MKTDWLIVGAGFTGAVLAERIASQLDQRVLVIDKRSHIGGNAFDYYDEHGVQVHKYGAHIFHTNSRRIWDYVSQFTAWRPYRHEVRGLIEGQLVPIPFNLNTMRQLFARSRADRLERRLVERYGAGAKVTILKMLADSDDELRELAAYIYKNVFEGYTLKQWGLRPEELDASVTARVPVVVSQDDGYFADTYQGMPRGGYTELFNRMLSHENIQVELNADYRDAGSQIGFGRMVFTGAIDEYFQYAYGPLPYRSLRFELVHKPVRDFQGVSVVNYPNDYDFTRTIEYKHFSGQDLPGSTIGYEYPEPHEPGVNIPYYPIPRKQNEATYSLYRSEAAKLEEKVLFAGRLADYTYYNMDQAVGRALKVFEQKIGCGAASGLMARPEAATEGTRQLQA